MKNTTFFNSYSIGYQKVGNPETLVALLTIAIIPLFTRV